MYPSQMIDEKSGTSQKNQGSRPMKSFLLRCWQPMKKAESDLNIWNFMLKEVGETPHKHNFQSLEELFDFLANILDQESEGTHND